MQGPQPAASPPLTPRNHQVGQWIGGRISIPLVLRAVPFVPGSLSRLNPLRSVYVSVRARAPLRLCV